MSAILAEFGIESTKGFLPVIIIGLFLFIGALIVSVIASFSKNFVPAIIIYNAGFTLYLALSLTLFSPSESNHSIFYTILLIIIVELPFIPITLIAIGLGKVLFGWMRKVIFGR